MNQWLDQIARDRSPTSSRTKVIRNRPPELVDACWSAEGEKISEAQTFDGPGRCNKLYPSHADPRIAAGGPLTDDILKCALKPVAATDYAYSLTTDQMWRLKKAFPDGVCDYSRPGVEQSVVTNLWLTY